VGGVPVLTEIDESLTMDPIDAEAKITPRTRFILPVHMLGNPCDMERIVALAKRRGLTVIEDCCQALGGAYQGKKLGTIGALGAFSLNSYKVIYAVDGGLLVTSDRDLYERAFAFHDQGHLPLRKGVEIGNRSLIGINMRMNEMTGAFALGQLRKLDRILAVLHEKKQIFKRAIQEGNIRNMAFRRINDPGECATLVTVQFEDETAAGEVAKALHTRAIAHSGWHVYNNMEQLLAHRDPAGNQPYHKHMLPQTDAILGRSLNLSVGVVDPGLGADFGITPVTPEEEILCKAEEFVRIVKPIVD
jgi:dTDP-4-amino-4,6-dideoxygalactose transaminase